MDYQVMMVVWQILACLAVLLPLGGLIFWCRGALSGISRPTGWALLLLSCGISFFLLSRPHEGYFEGLDSSSYRLMADAFRAGRGFHDKDELMTSVPPAGHRAFHYRWGTRDTAFLLRASPDVEGLYTVPWFQPLLSLAAAGVDRLGGRTEYFVPLVGCLWAFLLLLQAVKYGGGWGLGVCLALMTATIWPAWFLRGFHGEAVGAVLVSAVVAAAAIRPFKGWMWLLVGFALGLPAGFHRTAGLVAIPVAIVLILERGRWQDTLRLCAGLMLGFGPAWAIARWVCSPYGVNLLSGVAKSHWSMQMGLPILFGMGCAGVGCFHFLFVRRMAMYPAVKKFVSWGCAGIVVLAVLLPRLLGGRWEAGWRIIGGGIGWSVGLLFVAGCVAVFATKRPMRERLLLACICLLMWFPLYVMGLEKPANLWNFRRFVPTVLVLIPLLLPALGAAVQQIWQRRRSLWMATGLAGFLLVTGGWHLVRWPVAYGGINDAGAAAWVTQTKKWLPEDGLVLFDYLLHSVPHTVDLSQRVLGVSDPTPYAAWDVSAPWAMGRAVKEPLYVVSSWEPPLMEEGVRFETMSVVTGMFGRIKSKDVFPAWREDYPIRHVLMRAVPLTGGDAHRQVKVLDGGPLGIRGPWGQRRPNGIWTRQGSGVVGPVPPVGGHVRLQLACAWTPPEEAWTQQELVVTAPWGESVEVVVPSGEHEVTVEMTRSEHADFSSFSGVYQLKVKKPYNPGIYGTKGYSADLGILLRQVVIECIPAPAAG